MRAVSTRTGTICAIKGAHDFLIENGIESLTLQASKGPILSGMVLFNLAQRLRAAQEVGLTSVPVRVVDFNDQQADGKSTDALATGDERAKWEAFGWHAQRVDGNDLAAVVAALDAARAEGASKPRVIIFDTRMCKGVPFLETREITHFVRVEPDEWSKALSVLEEGKPA